MPVVPELRAIWDAMRPSYQAVLAGTKTAEAGGARICRAGPAPDQRNERIDRAAMQRHDPSAIGSIVFFLVAPAFVVLFGVVIYPVLLQRRDLPLEHEPAAHPGLEDHRVRPVRQGVHRAVAARSSMWCS